jgi:hypothetical protein
MKNLVLFLREMFFAGVGWLVHKRLFPQDRHDIHRHNDLARLGIWCQIQAFEALLCGLQWPGIASCSFWAIEGQMRRFLKK